MTDDELNDKIAALDGAEYDVNRTLYGTGKCIPYFGWYWRDVDFSSTLYLGYTENAGWDIPDYVGFMENNKWGYPLFRVSDTDRDTLRELLVEAVTDTDSEILRAVFDFMQALKPTTEKTT